MPQLPSEFLTLILPYANLFCKRVFVHVQLLLTGAILAPGKRTVTSVLRIMGLSQEKAFHKYHRVLSHTRWSALQASHILLNQLLGVLIGDGPLVVGIDEHLERRWGAKIKGRGIYRDAVRSSGSHFVKSSGLRWVSVMVLTPISWAKRVWALPFLTALAPSERYYEDKLRAHKPLTVWARQLLLLVKRWAGERAVVAVGDQSYAVIDLLRSLQGQVALISRLRLDAALYEPAGERESGQRGRKRLKGKRLAALTKVAEAATTIWTELTVVHGYGGKSQTVEYTTGTALWYHTGKKPVPIRWVLVRWEGKLTGLVCNDTNLSAVQIIEYFIWRWSVEVTFAQVRAHLGVETQRQWSDLAIARTTPVLMGLFSLVTLLANTLWQAGFLLKASSSWYEKDHVTFSDAIGNVRCWLWGELNFETSAFETGYVKMPRQQFLLWQSALAWAA